MGRLRNIGRLRAGGSQSFNPASLFSAGEQGLWIDPSDFSTMFQDSAGTTPVTATTQPVGKILDKSGNARHLTQATAAARPTLQQDGSGFYYLLFDGVDDQMSGTGWTGFTQSALALSANYLGSLDTALHIGLNVPNQIIYLNESVNRWGGFATAPIPSALYAANQNRVLLEVSRAANDVDLYTDGNAKETITTGTAYDSRTLTLCGAGTQFSNARIYQGLALGRLPTASEVALIKTFFGAKMGVAL